MAWPKGKPKAAPKAPALSMRVTIELRPHVGGGLMLDADRDVTTEVRMLRSDYEGLGPRILRGTAAEVADQIMARMIEIIRKGDEKMRAEKEAADG